ncbi:MAG: hypothetical protein EBZ48_16010 [Proteobacteria bacterium]|nr:hypothetical protein [Pseudomonadota bacterium]
MPSQKKFRIGDLVVHTFDDRWNVNRCALLVIGLREDATGPYEVCKLLSPDGTTFERYVFELQLFKEEERGDTLQPG